MFSSHFNVLLAFFLLVCQPQVLCRHHRQYQHHQVCPLRQGNKRLPSYVTMEFNLI